MGWKIVYVAPGNEAIASTQKAGKESGKAIDKSIDAPITVDPFRWSR